MAARIEQSVFGFRALILAVLGVLTIFFAYQATQLRIDAGFDKHLPLAHPYIETFLEYREAFGGADLLVIAVRARDGDIFTPHFLETLEQVTDAVFFLPGVDRSSVRSLFTPNVGFVEVVEGGFAGGNVIPAGFEPTQEGLEQVRDNVLKADLAGRLVADDFSAALVSAELLEQASQAAGSFISTWRSDSSGRSAENSSTIRSTFTSSGSPRRWAISPMGQPAWSPSSERLS